MSRLRTIVRYAAVTGAAAFALTAAEHRGQVKSGGLPVPGATVMATQGQEKVTATTDGEGVYSYADLPDGNWTIAVQMSGFALIEREVAVGPPGPAAEWELKMLPLEAMNAQVQATTSPRLAVSAPASPKSRGTPPPRPTTTQTPFQRTDLNASATDTSSPSGDSSAAVSAQFADASGSELDRRAADGFLVNGSALNGATTPFAQSPAFGNNRSRFRRLYNGNVGLILDTSKLDARPFSLTGQNTPRPGYNRVQGVASFGGPLWIPGLIRYGPTITLNYRWVRNRNANTQSTLMPGATERTGDLSALPNRIYDPASGLPFFGNVIPVSRLSPQASALLRFYPLPNSTSNQYNYQIPIVSNAHQDNFQSNVNHSWRRHQLTGRLALQSGRTDNPNVFGFLDTGNTTSWNATLNWRRNFRRRFITAGLQFNRLAARTTPFFVNQVNVAGEAGISGNNQESINWGPPALNFASGIATLSDAQYSLSRNQTTGFSFQAAGIPGTHNFVFGGDYSRQQVKVLSQQDARGTFTFTGAATQAFQNGVPVPGTGSDLAGFLLGIPDTSSIAFGNADKYFRGQSWDAFINDDWRVRSGFTLNLGVRWEYSSPVTELRGRLVNLDIGPDFSTATPVVAAGMPNTQIRPDRNNIAPRIGVAWRPFFASSLLFRGGYGVYFDTSVYQSIASRMAQQSPLSYSLRVQNSPSHPLTLANGFVPSPAITANTFAIDPDFRIGYSQNWQLSVQKELPASMTMIATYEGIKGTRAQQQFLPNTFPIGAASPCGLCPTGFSYLTSNGNSIRHAGTVELRRRLRSGFTATLQYTYAKSQTPRYERYDRMVRGFGFDKASPIANAAASSSAAVNCPACVTGLKGGLQFADSQNRYAFVSHAANFQPRIGVAYRPAARLVFRGGYGLSYLGQNASGPATGFSRQTPVVASLDSGLTSAVSLSDPFPSSIYPDGLLRPIGASQGLATNLGQNISFQYLDRSLPYSQQYSAGFQFEFASDWLLEASYVGNLTKRLPVNLGLNFIPVASLTAVPVSQRQAFFNQQITNPFAGVLPNSSLNGGTVARQQLLFAFPQYGSGTQITDVPIGSQRYDSLQVKINRRFSRRVNLTVAYTFSKVLEQVSVLNAQDTDLQEFRHTRLEKRLTQFDVPQQLSIIGSYDIPGRVANVWLNRIASGLTISGVWMSHSGFPLAFPNAEPFAPRSAKLTDAQRDSLAQSAGRQQYDPSYDVWFDTSLFPRTAQAPFTLRTFPTRFPDVRTKPLNVCDLSVYKQFSMSERVRLQIRVDAHNVGNFPWFSVLDNNGNNVTNPLFGHLRADIGNETRVIVGVMKVVF